jgi:hypothetical protein
MKLNVNCEVDVEELIRSNSSYEELENFFIEFDLSIGDVGFTENIIEKLVNSMVMEYSKSPDPAGKKLLKHWTSICNTIKEIKKIPE